MALTIQWSKKASQRFEEVASFLEFKWNEKVKIQFIQKVFDFLALLQEFPELGSIENKQYNIRGFVIVKQITIFYQVRNDKIILLNFYDNRQQPKLQRF